MQWEGFQSHSLSYDSFLPFTTQLHQIIFRIPGAWRDSSTVNTVEKSCHSRKKKDSWVVEESTIDCYLLNNHASNCWTIVRATVKQSCQQLLKNCASDCWRIASVTVEQLCRWLLNKCASDYWTIVSVTYEWFCQWVFKNRSDECS